MARILNDPQVYRLAIEAADHQCQGERTRAKTTEQCIHSDRAGYVLVLVVDDTRGALVLCKDCLAKLQAPIARRAERAVLAGQESLF